MTDPESQNGGSGWAHRRTASRELYAGILILFCFPFAEIQCRPNMDDTVIVTHSWSGLQLALGGHSVTTESAAKSTTTHSSLIGQHVCPLMTVFGISIVVALAVSIITPTHRNWAIAETVCAIVALAALLFQFVPFNMSRGDPGPRSQTEYSIFERGYTGWLHLTYLCSLAAVALATLRIRTSKEASIVLEVTEQDPPDAD